MGRSLITRIGQKHGNTWYGYVILQNSSFGHEESSCTAWDASKIVAWGLIVTNFPIRCVTLGTPYRIFNTDSNHPWFQLSNDSKTIPDETKSKHMNNYISSYLSVSNVNRKLKWTWQQLGVPWRDRTYWDDLPSYSFK